MAALGFDVLYLMPVWARLGGHYAAYDHYQIDRRVGTEAEVRAFVEAAHVRGMKVLFDFVPQRCGVLGPLAEQRPEWLVRDRRGRPFGSHGWGPPPADSLAEVPAAKVGHTYSLDWGREDVRDYMLDWAEWNVRTFGVDGFRTDALHRKEANLAPDNPAPAWRTIFGGVRLGEALAERLGPGKLLFGELGGPAFAASHPATYENGWVMAKVNPAWLAGEPALTARQWREWKRDNEATVPQGSRRASYTASHDMTATAELARTSPLADALAFAHAFSGGAAGGMPFVTWGELDWPAIDAGGDGRRAFFAAMLEARRGLAGRACHWDVRASGDDEHLFACRWAGEGGEDRYAPANLSPRPLSAEARPVGQIELPAGGWRLVGVDGTLLAGA